jgi:hypothetical protein
MSTAKSTTPTISFKRDDPPREGSVSAIVFFLQRPELDRQGDAQHNAVAFAEN